MEARACGLQPGVRLYNLVVIAYARRGRAAEAEAFVRKEMAAGGVIPDVVTW
jgi:pentatricopeptide repeat protein